MLLVVNTTFLILTIFAVLFGLTVVITGFLFVRALLKYRNLRDRPQEQSDETPVNRAK